MTLPLVVETLSTWRRAHPGWGPKTLRAKLLADDRFRPSDVPSERSIARFLRAADLSRQYQRHTDLPTLSSEPAHLPHPVWELDAKGAERVLDVGRIALIDLNDRASHVHLLSYPCGVGTQRVVR